MTIYPSHAEVISKWRYRADLVRALGVAYTNVQGWHLRSSIPEAFWPAIEQAAREVGIKGVTVIGLRAAALVHQAAKPPRKKHVRKSKAEASHPSI